MPGGGYTGDGSVKWFIDMYDAAKGFTRVDPVKGGKGLHLEGLDNASGREFVIAVKLPPVRSPERAAFVAQLENQWREAQKPGATYATLKLAVERKGKDAKYPPDSYQIRITWDE